MRNGKVPFLLEVLFIQAASLDKNVTDLVRIAVRRRSTILKVATLILSNISWDSDWTTSVGNTSREVVNRRSFMHSSQTSFIILSCKDKTRGIIRIFNSRTDSNPDMGTSAVVRVIEQCCFNSVQDPFNGQTVNFILKSPKVIESRTYVKKANLECYWNNTVL